MAQHVTVIRECLAFCQERGVAFGGGEGAVCQFHVELCRRCKPRDAEIRNEASGDEAQLAEVVENLMRANLNPAEGGQM